MVTKTGKMSAVFRAGRKLAKNKKVSEVSKLIKSQAEEAYREKLANVPVAELVSIAVKVASGGKSPVGADGTNLNAVQNRDVSIVGKAIGDVTTSSSMYMYRPSRKRSMQGVNYVQKTRWTTLRGANAGEQFHGDCSILDAVPVFDNPPSNSKYSNLTIKKAFDDFLIASNIGDDKLKLQQTSIHMKSLTAELNITNRNTDACILDIYEVMPKHTLGPTTYANEYSATGYMSPSWTWATGLSSDTPMLEDTLTATTVGSKPSDSVNFSRTWNVIKHVKVNLTGGSTHIHKSAYAINKTVSYQEYAQFSTSGGKLSGWNPTYLFRLRGVPNSDNALACASSVAIYCDMQLNYSGYMSEGARAIVFDDKT